MAGRATSTRFWGSRAGHGEDVAAPDSLPFSEAIMATIEELKERKTWVAWRLEPGPDGKPTKVPYNPKTGRKAASTRPAEWLTYADAERHAGAYDGLGIILTDGLCGADVDHCVRPDGSIDERGRMVLDRLASYAEMSPSGTGLHVLCFAALPPTGRKNTALGIEVYGPGSPRFLTFTGSVLAGARGTVEDRHEQFAALHRALFAPQYVETRQAAMPPADIDTTDAELLAAAFTSRTGAEIIRLFNEPGAPGNSEGDASLCGKLAFYSGGDPARLERMMRASARWRDKWESRRGDMTWLALECHRAIMRHSGGWFTPRRKPRPEGGAAYVKGLGAYSVG